MSLTEYDEEEAKKVFHDDGYNEGVQVGAAQQKVKDDLILAAALSEKDAVLSEKDAVLSEKEAEIARLKAQLASK